MKILGINAVFHDPAAALVVDGVTVAAAEEERFTRRKHGKSPVPFSTWELPTMSARWCLRHAGIEPSDLDAVAYSYDPRLAPLVDGDVTADGWEGLRTLYASRAPRFLATALPGLDPGCVRFVPHHVAHAASAYLAAGFGSCAVLVLDGRGERASHLAAHVADGHLRPLAAQELPHSLGLFYEELTERLGFHRSSDEYKVMALAAYGSPSRLAEFRRSVRVRQTGFRTQPIDWDALDDTPAADLAASAQTRLNEVVLELAEQLHRATGERCLAMAGGVALNCVANSHLVEHGPFDRVWVQPAAGDAGTALGAALHVGAEMGEPVAPVRSVALGRGWTDEQIEAELRAAKVPHTRPTSIAAAAAEVLAGDGVVAWFQGRSEYGPRALGQRSLLANPADHQTIDRLNAIKGRESFRPVAPMVSAERATEIFEGPFPSPYMLFVHRVRPGWEARIPAAVHVDRTARAQSVDRDEAPLVAALLDHVDRLTGVPVVINTSLNTAGRPMVDSPRDALELFGSAPVDALAIGPFLVRRAGG